MKKVKKTVARKPASKKVASKTATKKPATKKPTQKTYGLVDSKGRKVANAKLIIR